MNKFERTLQTLDEIIGETTNEDGSLDDFIEDLSIAIACVEVVKKLNGLFDSNVN